MKIDQAGQGVDDRRAGHEADWRRCGRRARGLHDQLFAAAKRILASKRDVVIEAHGPDTATVTARATAVREQLIAAGVTGDRIHVVPKVGAGETERVRLVAVAAGAAPAARHAAMPDTPVGESRFMAERPMTVRAGSSAMVAMVHGETTGGVVYLYDPVSERGDQRFAFKAVRLDNPTGDALEAGPVTVFGDGRFIGEGITEAVPPHASVVIPFALDRQIVVERAGHEDDRVAKLVSAQRGVVTAELQHRRTTTFKVTSRLAEPTVVYLRHRLESGWTMVDAPPSHMTVGDSQLFAVDLPPGATRTVAIVEATPVERSLELASDDALALMQLYVDEPGASPGFKAGPARPRPARQPPRRRRSGRSDQGRCTTSSASTASAPASSTPSSSRSRPCTPAAT